MLITWSMLRGKPSLFWSYRYFLAKKIIICYSLFFGCVSMQPISFSNSHIPLQTHLQIEFGFCTEILVFLLISQEGAQYLHFEITSWALGWWSYTHSVHVFLAIELVTISLNVFWAAPCVHCDELGIFEDQFPILWIYAILLFEPLTGRNGSCTSSFHKIYVKCLLAELFHVEIMI